MLKVYLLGDHQVTQLNLENIGKLPFEGSVYCLACLSVLLYVLLVHAEQ